MSKKNLSKKDSQADFTRGGQITFHNIRMLAQVSTKVAKIGFYMFLAMFTLGMYWMTSKELFWSVFEFWSILGNGTLTFLF